MKRRDLLRLADPYDEIIVGRVGLRVVAGSPTWLTVGTAVAGEVCAAMEDIGADGSNEPAFWRVQQRGAATLSRRVSDDVAFLVRTMDEIWDAGRPVDPVLIGGMPAHIRLGEDRFGAVYDGNIVVPTSVLDLWGDRPTVVRVADNYPRLAVLGTDRRAARGPLAIIAVRRVDA